MGRRCLPLQRFPPWRSSASPPSPCATSGWRPDPMKTPYSDYDLLSRWRSVSYDDVTRRVLNERLRSPPERRYLSQPLYAVLEAACARVIPQPDRHEPVPIAPWIDRQ